MNDRSDDADWGDAKEITVTGVLVSDRADEIAQELWPHVPNEGGKGDMVMVFHEDFRGQIAAALRAYGDERVEKRLASICDTETADEYEERLEALVKIANEARNAALEEAEQKIWEKKMSQYGYAAAIRALKEKP